jgi:hypothetical protein
MKPLVLVAALVATAALAVPAHAVVLQTEARTWRVGPDHRVRLDFPVGELHVKATDGDEVRVELQVRCRRSGTEECQRKSRRLRLEHTNDGGVLRIRVEGYPKFNSRGFSLEALVLVPRHLRMDVDMGVGELEVDGMAGDLDVELGVGDATILAPRGAVKTVNVDVGIGDASLRTNGHRAHSRGWLGREVRWSEGGGASRIELSVGVGEGDVSLR